MSNPLLIKSHFLNSLIWRGKKLTAEKFFHNIIFSLKSTTVYNQFDIFYYSMLNLRPMISLRPVKVGSVVYKTPAPLSDHRRRLYSIKFLLSSSRDSRGSITSERIVSLLESVYFGTKNSASDKKFALYREGLGNRLFIRKLR